MKRLLDFVGAGILLLLALPLCLVLIPILALTGEGEIFYSQTRIGLGRRRFSLLKFATMKKQSEKAGTITVPGDPRVLPLGRFLRKTKLNELPQVWNVLRGDMSLVGPRPLAEQEFAFYSPEVRARVVQVRPGLTGVGSVVFRDEEALLSRSDLPPSEVYRRYIAPRKGQLECWYLDNRSLPLDLMLVVLTAIAVISPGKRRFERWLPGPGPSFEPDGQNAALGDSPVAHLPHDLCTSSHRRLGQGRVDLDHERRLPELPGDR
jgi:lipopolysaccharide/colanic/teichoic acid biosynthesis glycosyltransferase